MSAKEIDPSKVKSGDTVTLTHSGEDVEVRGPLHDHQPGYFWSIHRLGTLYVRDGWTITAHEPAPAPVLTTLTVPFDPKMLREAFCVAQHAVRNHVTADNHHGAPEVLETLIRECDRHRPLGPDGKHGQRHTPTCGCDDVPEQYQPAPAPEWKPGTAGTGTVCGARQRVFRVAVEEDASPKYVWVTEMGHRTTESIVSDFVPDDAEALRAEVEHWRGVAQSRQYDELEAEADSLRAELYETQQERDEARATRDMHKERTEQAEAAVERLRAARTLPTREQVERAIAKTLYTTPYDEMGWQPHMGNWASDSAASDGLAAHLAPSVFALFEQGGAAPTCPHGQTAEELCNRLPDDRTLTAMRLLWDSLTPASQRVWWDRAAASTEVAE